MRDEQFTNQIKKAADRAEVLQLKLDSLDTEISPQALEELQVALEELRVADEELHLEHEQRIIVQQELQLERQRYKEMFEFAPDAYLVTDMNGLIEEANQAACRMLNSSRRFSSARSIDLLVEEPARAQFRSQLKAITQGDARGEMELRLAPTNGKRAFQAALTVAVSRNHDGKALGCRWLIRDIAERHLHEQQIRELNQDLEHRVQERTAELEASNRMKDEFLATLSHELRTPLNAILGWARLLRTGLDNRPLAERAAETIERSAIAQARLISDLLDVSRIIAGKLKLNLKIVHLDRIIISVIDATRLQAESRGLKVYTRLDGAVVPGDSDRLEQVIGNLLANAIKFTSSGGSIEVTLEASGDNAVIVMTDTGIGIHPEALPHVFEKFKQERSSSKRAAGGLGLGLSIVHKVVELHGGTVLAESEGPGRGSRFTVRLPLVEKMASIKGMPARLEDATLPVLPNAGSSLKGARILVVDDEVDAREMLCVVFRQRGAIARAVPSCAAALIELSRESPEERPNILVSDIAMATEDGYDLIRKVREMDQERGERLPAIAVTAYAGVQAERQALESGYDSHVSKPVDFAQLTTVVSTLLHGH